MPVKGGTKCIKYLLFGFNFIFWVSERDSRALLCGATCPPRGPARGRGVGNWHCPPGRLGAEEKGRCGRQLAALPSPRTGGAGTFLGGSRKQGRQGDAGAPVSWGVETGPPPLLRQG